MDENEERADADRLVTVFRGTMNEVVVVQSLFRAAGLFTHVANQNIKTIDPFITGTNIFDIDLQVPVAEQQEAEDILATRQREPQDPRSFRRTTIVLAVCFTVVTLLVLGYAYSVLFP